MSIEFITDVKTVIKPWGWEKWIQPGSEVYPFVLKQLLLKAGERTSLQVHRVKSESIMILEGNGTLLTYDPFFDCELFLEGEYSDNVLEYIKNNLIVHPIKAGDMFHTPPGTIHRMIAETDLLYIEASTTQLDDVIRLQDDQKRDHGRIASEHR
jgi:mannose-6-phosphate isomerase-like protein (cupin superfamily)